jgi:hypothetical protein
MSIRLDSATRTVTFARAIKAKLACDNNAEAAAERCRQLYGAGSAESIILSSAADRYTKLQLIERGAVPSSDYGDIDLSAASPAETSYIGAVRERSVPGRLPGLQRRKFNHKFLSGGGPVGHFAAEGRAIPFSRTLLSGVELTRHRVSAIMGATKESLVIGDRLGDEIFDRELRTGVAFALDAAFLDPANDGSGAAPASVTYNAPSQASSGDIAVDLREIISNFAGDLTSAVFVTHPAVAASIATARDSSGNYLFQDCGPGGGSLLNIPLLTTRASLFDTSGSQIALIDGGSIAYADEALAVARSDNALLELDDDPQGYSTAPTAASATLLSAFQADLAAIKFTFYCDWLVVRPGGVAVLSGVAY